MQNKNFEYLARTAFDNVKTGGQPDKLLEMMYPTLLSVDKEGVEKFMRDSGVLSQLESWRKYEIQNSSKVERIIFENDKIIVEEISGEKRYFEVPSMSQYISDTYGAKQGTWKFAFITSVFIQPNNELKFALHDVYKNL
jgi:hypothetical protein